MKEEGNKEQKDNKERNKFSWIGVAAIIIACIIVIFAVVLHLRDIPFGPYDTGDIVMMLLMMSFIALIIERAVEVVMIVLRKAGEKELQDKVNELEKQLKEKGECDNSLPDAEAELRNYKANTCICALSLLFVLGIIISAIGLRVLLPLVNMAVFKDISSRQKTIFNVIDIVLTGALLGGGSKGIHEIVEGVLNSAEWYRDFVKHKRKKLDV